MTKVRSNTRGLSISQEDHEPEMAQEVPWEEVDRVIAYKKDCFAVDQIRFEFQLRDGRTLLVTEDMPGWKELIRELPNLLVGFPTESEWFQRLAQPPFAANLRVLYDRTTRP